MNKINRSLVKSQARQIIKGKVFYLFIITFIVSLLTTGSSAFLNLGNLNIGNRSTDYYNDYSEYFDGYDDFDDYDDSYDFSQDNPIENFQFNSVDGAAEITNTAKPVKANISSFFSGSMLGLSSVCVIITLVFTPLAVTLSGMYLSLIRKRADEEFQFGTELGGIFKNSFNNSYLNKFVLLILKDVLIFLLTLLLIIPGCIFYYSSYFAAQIMVDNPNLKPSEAIKLSKKMIKGNRTELFVLDLSFIPWILLIFVTLGIASIYVAPYIYTTQALYYENFRLRALAEGRITEDDFLSEKEKFEKYTANPESMNGAANSYQNTTYYSPDMNNQDNTQYNSGEYYTPDVNTPPMGTKPNEQEQQPYYYAPPESPQTPVQPEPVVQESEEQIPPTDEAPSQPTEVQTDNTDNTTQNTEE